ncbi:chloramphenicol acetyltransferase [Mucilaginibacter robiniae]|uniref:Chloramphenicol acetyltransferase n=1 Tax=Mucilaginibacter robiniae TaxID=2728022 RepID=A0A7L5E1G3_9SPHI|nr:chloramphenicol acetyltransferase [Mucilaginibacter robiniae]QJD96237.1 chloramphenicol acetyltransferase [Mucilaginibacter robiniae]
MKTLINLDTWIRKDHFTFFNQFEEPFFGATVTIDCTQAYQKAKQKNASFFLYYLYRALQATNEIENFRYRIVQGEVYLFDQVHASTTVNRNNGTFGFAYLNYEPQENQFYQSAKSILDEAKSTQGLIPSSEGQNVIHCSAIPWLNFTSLSHARSFSIPDSCPKISFGKMTEENGKKTMPVSIHVHHGLADGYHVGLWVEKFQSLMY